MSVCEMGVKTRVGSRDQIGRKWAQMESVYFMSLNQNKWGNKADLQGKIELTAFQQGIQHPSYAGGQRMNNLVGMALSPFPEP